MSDALTISVDDALGNCAHYLREELGLTAAAEQIEAVNAAVSELVEAATQAECGCTLHERDSGHKLGCWMPNLKASIMKVTRMPSNT